MSHPQSNIFENANQKILIATFSVKCNNHNKIGFITIFHYFKMEAIQWNIKHIDIKNCAMRNTVTFSGFSVK